MTVVELHNYGGPTVCSSRAATVKIDHERSAFVAVADATIVDHRRPSSTIVAHRRPSSTIVAHRQPSSTIVDHRRPSSTIVDHRQTPSNGIQRTARPRENLLGKLNCHVQESQARGKIIFFQGRCFFPSGPPTKSTNNRLKLVCGVDV